MVKQLLHVPTVRARELAANGQQDDYVAGLEAVYGITVEQHAARRSASGTEAECPVDHSAFPAADGQRETA
jgi:glutamyl-tRNA reductase